MTFNKCSINGTVYGDQDDVRYGKSEDMIKVRSRTRFAYET